MRPIMRTILDLRIGTRIDQLSQSIGVVASLMCFVLMLVEVFVRYLLKKPLMAVEELICLIAFWAYFMGGSMEPMKKAILKLIS